MKSSTIVAPLVPLRRRATPDGSRTRQPRSQRSPDPLILARRLLARQDAVSMVQVLGRETGAFVSVESPRGVPVASHPAPVRALAPEDPYQLAEYQIRQGDTEIGILRHSAWLDRATLDLAASVLVHPLLRELDRRLEERRELGLALQAVIDGERNGHELRRLLRRRGMDPGATISVIAADTGPSAAHPPLVVCERAGSHSCTSALIDRQHLVLAQDDADVAEHAEWIFTRLDRAAPRRARVGIGEAPRGAADLRTALIEANEALLRGTGINERRPLTMGRLLCALPPGPLQDHTRSLLEPVLRHDEERQTELLKTLRALVTEDFSIVRTAKALFVHQNTVKYRAGQIGELTGLAINGIDGRAQLWIAVTLLDQLLETPAS